MVKERIGIAKIAKVISAALIYYLNHVSSEYKQIISNTNGQYMMPFQLAHYYRHYFLDDSIFVMP